MFNYEERNFSGKATGWRLSTKWKMKLEKRSRETVQEDKNTNKTQFKQNDWRWRNFVTVINYCHFMFRIGFKNKHTHYALINLFDHKFQWTENPFFGSPFTLVHFSKDCLSYTNVWFVLIANCFLFVCRRFRSIFYVLCFFPFFGAKNLL